MMRPSWDAYFMDFARAASSRSSCDRAFVGAVLVRDNRILSTGYNGAPRGFPHCSGPDGVGHDMRGGHCVRTVHAEENAIFAAAYHGVPTVGSTLYSTHAPCGRCAKAIIQAGIVRVVYGVTYGDGEGIRLLEQAGIVVEQFTGEWGHGESGEIESVSARSPAGVGAGRGGS